MVVTLQKPPHLQDSTRTRPFRNHWLNNYKDERCFNTNVTININKVPNLKYFHQHRQLLDTFLFNHNK